MIKFLQSQALTSHFESFWNIVHCATYLSIFISINIDSSVNSQSGKFLVFLSLESMLVAKNTLIFVKRSPIFGSTSHMVIIRTPHFETFDRGTIFLTHFAMVINAIFKGEKVLKVNFLRRILPTFEFSRQNDMPFLAKIDISACQIWLKLKFCTFEIVQIPSFWI